MRRIRGLRRGRGRSIFSRAAVDGEFYPDELDGEIYVLDGDGEKLEILPVDELVAWRIVEVSRAVRRELHAAVTDLS